MRVSFFVPCIPQQKGSTKSFRSASTGRLVTVSDNKNLAPWAALVALTASQHWHSRPLLEDSVCLKIRFVLPRPKSVSIAKRPDHVVKPDLDKLLRGACDAMTNVIWSDDSQVIWALVQKTYNDDGLAVGAYITVWERERAEP